MVVHRPFPKGIKPSQVELGVRQAVWSLISSRARISTKYIAPNFIVRATRTLYKCSNRQVRDSDGIQIVLTIGRPNYLERDFVKLCQKASEKFPVRNVQLKFPPAPKKKHR